MMMKKFPPPSDQLVTLANWRTPPFNRWAFNHVRELVPSANIEAGSKRQPLDVCELDLDDFRLSHQGKNFDLNEWIDSTYTDSMVVVKNGKIAYEHYADGQSATIPHIWMSVSKSILGLIAGMVAAQGLLDPNSPITDLIPELGGTAFAGATVRDALDMRVGIKFDEDYHAKSGAIIEYRKSHLWDPLLPGDSPTEMRSFFSSLTERDGIHGDRFHYVSPNTDVLGWVLERATGTRFADLISQLLWQPIDAEVDAYITVDRFGAPRCAGGFCAVSRDMAKVGRLFITNGYCGARPVVPASWINDILEFDGTSAWRSGDFYELFGAADIHYRSQWYVQRGSRPMVYGMGVFGQNVFVDIHADLVIAKCSSQPLPLDKSFMDLTHAGIERLRSILA